MKNVSFARNRVAQALAIVSTSLLSAAAMAQATDPFTTAVTDITAKVTTYGGALVGVAAVGVVFMVAIKYVKKLNRAA